MVQAAVKIVLAFEHANPPFHPNVEAATALEPTLLLMLSSGGRFPTRLG